MNLERSKEVERVVAPDDLPLCPLCESPPICGAVAVLAHGQPVIVCVMCLEDLQAHKP